MRKLSLQRYLPACHKNMTKWSDTLPKTEKTLNFYKRFKMLLVDVR